MAKSPMDTLHFSCIQIAIALLLFTQAKSTTEDTLSALHPNDAVASCVAGERSALLAFRAGLSDPANLLSSWKGDDCCWWKGVYCSNRTGHVVKLDLRGPDFVEVLGGNIRSYGEKREVLAGNISSSLLRLQHLRYLDLSYNGFDEMQIPEFMGSLHQLRYLDLSSSQFIGRIPPQLGNLSNLRYLNLDSYSDTYSTDITWLSQLTSVEHLDMTGVNLSAIVHWLPVVNMLPTLKVLRLVNCQLRSSPDSIQFSNLTSLETLDLAGNNFHKRSIPNWFWDLTGLKNLYISSSGFYGPFPDEIGNMTSIVELRLQANNLVGMIPSNLKNLCNLDTLDFSLNNINGSIAELFHRLPNCSQNKLKDLVLLDSNLTGSLPTTIVEPLRNLRWLVLAENKLTGHVPVWIGDLKQLTMLDLSSNNLDGVMHEGHLSRLAMLEKLILSDNSIAITVSPTWVPPFSLNWIELQSCQLGPKFPMWLKWQTPVVSLDISYASINDMVPGWFWIATSSLEYLNIRNNQITGVLPSTMEFMRAKVMDFSSNQLGGPIPKLPINLTDLDLSWNNLVGPLPLDFGAPGLETLFLYDNMISGAIPSSLCKLRLLRKLNLSRNNLNGSITDCLVDKSSTNMPDLSIVNLSLRDNNLSGDFPLLLRKCPQLIFLDLGHNQFSGDLPPWIGEKLSSLSFLGLRSNMFRGHIPVELTKLVDLQNLDLAYNNISGIIPTSIVNWTGMTRTSNNVFDLENALATQRGSIAYQEIDYTENFTILTKGQERFYTREIIYMFNLDLSCNSLTGEIPEEIGNLVELKNLNLSWNKFDGKIPDNVGALIQVESLDLSHNDLSGEIPPSLSALMSLSRLNLSYNNLRGKIPTGNQLQTLEDPASIYIGNPGLCGPPLSWNCSQAKLAIREHQGDASGNMVSFFLASGSGYMMGLWVVLCTFLFKRRWRTAWYSFCDSLYDWAYVQVAVTSASLRGKING
ncbi:receptor-like protein EIX2 [Hordeum vulgare subsp. vulgare]|uniref:Leucine-rich repeat-containing N-terminal plant-type domain-containing protein n=1 Tax=Hordeum vulgare subsp. vulgare TaxID=112509 RepID=A0A8I7BG98_HORVV|nr:receptor-like protein EIX2 [Hordeum vulgare subsp. vulgare]